MLDRAGTQAELALLIGVTQPVVSDHESRGLWRRDDTLRQQVLAYCAHLREVAAGRYADGDLDLATERARLAREQFEKIRMQNEQTRRELAPVSCLSEALASVTQQIAAQLDAIVPRMKRKHELAPQVLTDLETEIARARNTAAEASFTLDDAPADPPSPQDEEVAQIE